MARQVQTVNTATDTFQILVDKTNEIIEIVNAYAITANSGTPDITSGNAFVNGYFGSNNLLVQSLSGGDFSSSSNLVITTNVSINSASVLVLGNTSVNSSSLSTLSVVIGNSTVNSVSNSTVLRISSVEPNTVILEHSQHTSNTFTTTGLSQQTVDQFATATFRSAEYLVSVKDNNANGYQTSKMIMVHDGTTALVTEYSVLVTNASLGVFAADVSGANVRLLFTPVSSNTSVKFIRELIEV
jgi:hypothetical protein